MYVQIMLIVFEVVLLVYTNLHLNCYPCEKRGKHGMVLSYTAFSHEKYNLHAVLEKSPSCPGRK